jgi:hypothetical protein
MRTSADACAGAGPGAERADASKGAGRIGGAALVNASIEAAPSVAAAPRPSHCASVPEAASSAKLVRV